MRIPLWRFLLLLAVLLPLIVLVIPMAETVVAVNEISLNGVRYPIAGQVRRSLASVYPGKLVTGDYTKDSSPILSVLALSDHRGGIGQDIYDGEGPANRSWYSTADIRYKGHLILPPLVTNTGGLPAGATQFGAMAEFKGNLYASIYTGNPATNGVYKYNDATDTWGTRVLDAGDFLIFYDAAVGVIGNTQYIVFSGTDGYYYSTDGTSWSLYTKILGMLFVTIWDDKLWGIGTSQTLWYAIAPGVAAISAGTLGFSNIREVRGLFVARDASGEDIIHAITTNGIYAYDFNNGRFIKTPMSIPSKTTESYFAYGTAARWRDSIYFAAETSLIKYDISGGQAAISIMGPDRDGGLPSGYGTLISRINPSLNDLLMSVNGTGTQKGLLLGWNTQGWRVLTELAASENFSSLDKWSTGGIFVSGAYGDYRVWFASDEGNYIKYIKLPSDLVNPLNVATYPYAAAALHDWPWFTAGQSDVTKVAVRVKVEVKGATATETAILSYATDFSESFTAFATISSNGITTFPFPNATTPTGTAFRALRFRAALARGSTTTLTPDIISVTLEYYKKLDPKYQFLVDVDLNNEYKGNTSKQLRAALLAAQETATLVEFTYRDPNSNTDATFYVQVQPIIGAEQTGFDERGVTSLQLREV